MPWIGVDFGPRGRQAISIEASDIGGGLSRIDLLANGLPAGAPAVLLVVDPPVVLEGEGLGQVKTREKLDSRLDSP